MRLKLNRGWLIAVAVMLVSGVTSFAENDPTASELKKLAIQNLKACQDEDLDAEMSTVHSQSPVYLITKQQTPLLFENFDLKYELTDFKYIGEDEDYAVARIKQKTTKVSGPAFKNNEIDAIAVFRKEKGQWRFWNQVILDTKYINN